MAGHAKTEASALQALVELTRAQPHTFTGQRGEAIVAVRVGAIYDAVQEGIRRASGADSFEQVDLEGVDPVAIAQNTCVVIEELVGTYPNIRVGS